MLSTVILAHQVSNKYYLLLRIFLFLYKASKLVFEQWPEPRSVTHCSQAIDNDLKSIDDAMWPNLAANDRYKQWFKTV